MNYRHGDVNLIRIDAPPEGLKEIKKENGRYILARGEATGSVHKIIGDFEVYEREGTIFLKVETPCEVTHTSDHETIVIEPGWYIQKPEREIDYFGDAVERKVSD